MSIIMSAEETHAEEVDALPPQPPAAIVDRLNDIVEGDKNGGPPATAVKEAEPLEKEESVVGNVEYYCGCGPWHPVKLQVLRDARVFTFLICLFATIEGALVSGFTSVVLSSLERRYGLPSTATGAIASTFDVAVLISVVFISYFGSRGHKPRWLGVGLIIQAVGSFIFSLPQFLFGQYRVSSSGLLSTETCQDGQDFTDCTSSTYGALFFFLLGNIFIGVGAAPLFTVGTSYLDEIVRPKHVSLHLGVFYMLSIVGPALGYALGGPFLSIYVDPWQDTHLTPNDPGWVGAWWLCFIFCGIVSLIIAIPFFCYPRLLPSSDEVRKEREKEMAKRCVTRDSKCRESQGRKDQIKDMIKIFFFDIRRIVTNPTWIFMTLAIASSVLVVSGFASFGPKYVETQFGLSASVASLTIGAVAIPTGGAGVVAGGLIIFFLKLKGRSVTLLQLAIGTIAVFPLLGLLLHCPTADIAGLNAAYPDGTTDLPDTRALFSTCFSGCNCTSSIYEPVCGDDGLVYFSPCTAGCFTPTNNTDADYEMCTCIAEQYLVSNITGNSTANDGLCDSDCGTKLIFFLLLIGLGLFSVFMLQIPNVLVTIRCVSEDQRTLALGVQSFFWRLTGTIPGPILFGAIFDSTCIFWQRECGRRGNCWVYNNTALSVRAVILAVFAMAGFIVFVFFCWLSYPRNTQVKESENEQEEEEDGEMREGPTSSHGNTNKSAEVLNGEHETEDGVSSGSDDINGGSERGSLSVIGKMQCRNSTAELLEVGSNLSSSSASTEL